MESFFLAETLKYLFLLFDEQNFINDNGSFGTVIELNDNKRKCVIESGGYVFNTEAHPIDIAAISCCQRLKDNENELDDTINLYDLFIKSNKQSKKDWLEFEESNFETNNDTQTIPQIYSTISDQNKFDYQSVDKTLINHEEDIQTIKIETSFSDKIKESSTIPQTSAFLLRTENETHCTQTSQIPLPKSYSSSSFMLNEQIKILAKQYSNVLDPIQNGTISKSIFEIKNSDYDQNDNTESESISIENKFFLSNDNHELLACPSQTFLIRLSLYGQMFE